MDTDVLSSNMEDYLEAIYNIVQEKNAARSKDIAEKLGVNRSSVTGALHSLAEKKLINYTPYDFVTLTPRGEKLAEGISHRHMVLREFFVDMLGIGEEEAEESACRMEHAASELLLERLERFITFLKTCPRAGMRWIDKFGYFCLNPDDPEHCERCIMECLNTLRERKKDE